MKLLLFLTVCASALIVTAGALAAAPQPAPDPFGSQTAAPLVVQQLTGPQARKLGAASDAGGAPVSGQTARDQPHDHEVDRVEESLDDRPRALAARRRLE